MFTTAFAAMLSLASQGVPYAPPAVLNPPPPLIEAATIANFLVPAPCVGSVPSFYPLVPTPVVIAHPDWYSYPGPAYWYANNVTPYHPVQHKPLPVMPKKEGEKR